MSRVNGKWRPSGEVADQLFGLIATKGRDAADFDVPAPAGAGISPSGSRRVPLGGLRGAAKNARPSTPANPIDRRSGFAVRSCDLDIE